ncbi:MAG TPA: OmpH family outer membrane protein [Gammaproteobacteria bacterium]|nr:OmpH family outer membrane protein [Gammaproteobacteria bacterium]
MISTHLASATRAKRSAKALVAVLPFIATIAGAMLTFSADAQTSLKIGVVNMGKLIDGSPQSQAVTEKLKTEFAPRQNEVLKLGKDLQDKQDRFQKDQAVMGEEERLSLERQIRDGQRDLQRMQNEYAEDLNARRTEESNKLLRDVVQRIQAYASAQKFDLVLTDAVYVSGTVDITGEVLKALQADGPKPSAAAPRAPAPSR